MDFWTNYKNLCSSKGMKPNTVAKEMGISSATITNWKNGTIPNGKILIQLAEYFKCSVDYLLGRTENPKVNKYENKEFINDNNNTEILKNDRRSITCKQI